MKRSLTWALLTFALEICVTLATSYQHHSEARWEISAAYFGTLVGYLLGRGVLWIPAATVVFALAKLRLRQLPILKLAMGALVLETATTLGSTIFRAERPPYGIFFDSFLWYLCARLMIWVPLACVLFGVLGRRPVERREPDPSHFVSN